MGKHTVKIRLVEQGRSYRLCLPVDMAEAEGLKSVAEITLANDHLVVRNPAHPRAGWAEAARRMAERGDGALLAGPLGIKSSWDLEEWVWYESGSQSEVGRTRCHPRFSTARTFSHIASRVSSGTMSRSAVSAGSPRN